MWVLPEKQSAPATTCTIGAARESLNTFDLYLFHSWKLLLSTSSACEGTDAAAKTPGPYSFALGRSECGPDNFLSCASKFVSFPFWWPAGFSSQAGWASINSLWTVGIPLILYSPGSCSPTPTIVGYGVGQIHPPPWICSPHWSPVCPLLDAQLRINPPDVVV